MNQFRAGMLILMLGVLSYTASAQTPVSASANKELEEAESKMLVGILHHNADYFKDYVANDYIAINADGIMAIKSKLMQIRHGLKF